MIEASFVKHQLDFKKRAGTSRGVLTSKDSWFLLVKSNGQYGIGECSTIQGLSPDLDCNLDLELQLLVDRINRQETISLLDDFWNGKPALLFAYEMAMKDLAMGGTRILYPETTIFNQGIKINGLVWMGSKSYMKEQIDSLLTREFDCIKIKVGAIDFRDELSLLKYIRSEFSPDDIEIRVDANGAFSHDIALERLKYLSDYYLHSIEQPIRQGQIEAMAELCEKSPISIALDEELIGVDDVIQKKILLTQIKPNYIILKPSLVGGIAKSEEWIDIATELNIEYWATSALESNIGLNTISQWTGTLDSPMPQGLGTGSLFTNNVESPLYVAKGCISYNQNLPWDYSYLHI